MINFTVRLIDRTNAKSLIEKWHYSKSINGVMSSYCFGLYDKENLIGALIYGKPAMANQWKKYVSIKEDLIELRRLACIDNTPKNTESFFIGYTLRWLKKNTKIKLVISYADPNYNHKGIIYKASNFKLIGMTAPGKIIIYKNKKYHDKAIRTTYNGKLKPFARLLKNALLSKDAFYKKQLGKYIYIYRLKND